MKKTSPRSLGLAMLIWQVTKHRLAASSFVSPDCSTLDRYTTIKASEGKPFNDIDETIIGQVKGRP